VHQLVRRFLQGSLPDSQRYAVPLQAMRAHWQRPPRHRARAQDVIGGWRCCCSPAALVLLGCARDECTQPAVPAELVVGLLACCAQTSTRTPLNQTNQPAMCTCRHLQEARAPGAQGQAGRSVSLPDPAGWGRAAAGPWRAEPLPAQVPGAGRGDAAGVQGVWGEVGRRGVSGLP
jgi:hypothetical protein